MKYLNWSRLVCVIGVIVFISIVFISIVAVRPASAQGSIVLSSWSTP